MQVCIWSLAYSKFWLSLNFNVQGLTPLILVDNFQSTWLKAVHTKLRHMGLPPEVVCTVAFNQAKATLKQRLLDIERQGNISIAPNFLAKEDTRYKVVPATYLIS